MDSMQRHQMVMQLLMMMTDWSAKRALRKQMRPLKCLLVATLPASLLPCLDTAMSRPLIVMPGCHPIWLALSRTIAWCLSPSPLQLPT